MNSADLCMSKQHVGLIHIIGSCSQWNNEGENVLMGIEIFSFVQFLTLHRLNY